MSKAAKKARGTTSIATVVSFDKSSRCGLKIVMAHTDGLEVTLTTMVDITKDGMTYIKDHGLNKMFEISGAKAIVENTEIGENDE